MKSWRSGELDVLKKIEGFDDGHVADFPDGFAADGDGQRFRAQTTPFTARAAVGAHEAFEHFHARFAVRFHTTTLEIWDQPFVRFAINFFLAEHIDIMKVHCRMVAAIEDDVLLLFRQILPRRVAIDAELVGEAEHELLVIIGDGATTPWRQRALVEALALIWDDEIEVKAHDLAKAAAGFAGAKGIVEGKELWRELRHGNATNRGRQNAR